MNVGTIGFLQGISKLQAIQVALSTASAIANLARFQRTTIMARRRNATNFRMVLIRTIFQRITLIRTLIMVCRRTKSISTVQTKRTMFAIITKRNKMFLRRINHVRRRLIFLINGQRRQEVHTRIILRVLRMNRTARCNGRLFQYANGTRNPQYRATFKVAFFRTTRSIIKSIQRTSTRRQFRRRCQGILTTRLLMRMIDVRVASQYILPIKVIRLGLRRIPIRLIIRNRYPIRFLFYTIRQPTRTTSASNFSLLRRRIRRAIIGRATLRPTFSKDSRRIRRMVISMIRLRILRQIIMRLCSRVVIKVKRIQRFNDRGRLITQVALRNSAHQLFQPTLRVSQDHIRVIRTVFSNMVRRPIRFFLISSVTITSQYQGYEPTRTTVT